MAEKTSTCHHCRKEIAEGATRCPHCQADLRNWARRHPIVTTLLVLLVIGIVFGSLGGSSSQGTGAQMEQDQMAQNNPSIKVLGTLPTNYIDKTFTLNVYAKTERYYNYGFDDENSWYSLKIWDSSVSGDFEGVYAYISKTANNKALIDQALEHPVFITVTATIPATKWEQDSNAFLEITSWHY
jgi:hypothetical protein